MKFIKPIFLFVCAIFFFVPSVTVLAEDPYVWPVEGSTIITSQYHSKSRSNHEGIDIGGKGCTIRATKSGTVVIVYRGCVNYAGLDSKRQCSNDCTPNKTRKFSTKSQEKWCNWGFGNGIVIKHDDGSGYSMYAHMNDDITVSEKDEYGNPTHVEAGQVLGTLGASGYADGPHLHFQLSKGINQSGSYMNPIDTFNPEGLEYIYDYAPQDEVRTYDAKKAVSYAQNNFATEGLSDEKLLFDSLREGGLEIGNEDSSLEGLISYLDKSDLFTWSALKYDAPDKLYADGVAKEGDVIVYSKGFIFKTPVHMALVTKVSDGIVYVTDCGSKYGTADHEAANFSCGLFGVYNTKFKNIEIALFHFVENEASDNGDEDTDDESVEDSSNQESTEESTEEENTEEESAEEESTEEAFVFDNELTVFLGQHISKAQEYFAGMAREEGTAWGTGEKYISYSYNDEVVGLEVAGPFFVVDANEMVTEISYHQGKKYSVYGIYNGMDIQRAVKELKKQGWNFSYITYAHGTAAYVAIYEKDGMTMTLVSDTEGDFHEDREADLKGNVASISVVVGQ